MNPTLQEKLRHLPEKPGCYLYRDHKGTIIYVGKAINLRRRVQSYFRASTLKTAPPKLRSLIHHIEDLEYRIVRNEAEALLTESALIKQYKPHFNIELRDDKRYLALRADPTMPYGRLTTCRLIRNDGALYFGPFPSATVVKATLDFTEKRFGLRKCRDIVPSEQTHRHCLADVIRFCSAPCLGRISQADYRKRFDAACAFLRGENPEIIEEVHQEMITAAAAEKFERAAILRDTWLALKGFLKERGHARLTPLHRNDAEPGLAELVTHLNLPQPPHVIECFDISHLGGSHMVASMVVSVDGVPDKRRYRRFHIQSLDQIDDPRAIEEVVGRRYRRQLDEGNPLPDLILIDGGITQLRAARRALHALNLDEIPSIGIAERFEVLVLDKPERQELFLPRDSSALLVLMRLRDEAHRFAITFNRSLRTKAIRTSLLDEIPGIGVKRKAQLLKVFGSIGKLAQATEAELVAQPGITPLLAQEIMRTLSSSHAQDIL